MFRLYRLTCLKRRILTILLCLFTFYFSSPAQNSRRNISSAPKSASDEPDLDEGQRREFAISLTITLATDARSFSDLALRSRVLARAGDVLWDADNATARDLFIRAWAAAESGDAEGPSENTKDNVPAQVVALRKLSGRDLRTGVLTLVSRRDKALAQEFLAKLKSENDQDASDTKLARSAGDVFAGPEAAAKRLQIAAKLLADGEVDLAREFAAPALTDVNFRSIGFLAELRAKDATQADRMFGWLMSRTELDPTADANTVSGLSSYAFTPGFYIVFWPDGHSTWTQPDTPTVAPNLSPALRDQFFHVAANVLLRPLVPLDQDRSSCGRRGKAKAITRLLPLFDLYAPDTATALRGHLSAIAARNIDTDEALLTEGIKPEPNAEQTLDKIQDQLDHARSSAERDQIYAAAAARLASAGKKHACELADSINDPKLREQVRHYVDFELLNFAVRKKDAVEVVQLARADAITHTERAWAYTQVARLLPESEHERALSFLDQATFEARRIDANDSDRPFALIAVANQMLTLDRDATWDLLTEIVKAANSSEDFGANDLATPKPTMLVTRAGTRFTRMPDQDFAFSRVLSSLALEDLDRSVELVQQLKGHALRSNSILAIAKTVLNKPPTSMARK